MQRETISSSFHFRTQQFTRVWAMLWSDISASTNCSSIAFYTVMIYQAREKIFVMLQMMLSIKFISLRFHSKFSDFVRRGRSYPQLIKTNENYIFETRLEGYKWMLIAMFANLPKTCVFWTVENLTDVRPWTIIRKKNSTKSDLHYELFLKKKLNYINIEPTFLYVLLVKIVCESIPVCVIVLLFSHTWASLSNILWNLVRISLLSLSLRYRMCNF